MPEVKGMTALDARPIVVERLKELGALVSTEDYTHNVGKCERCKTTIEPRVSEQWFVKMEELAKPAIEVVRNDDVKFVPKRYEKTYFNWMENIQDWCISRQLWWGHQIPAYYCDKCGHINVAKTKPEKCEECGCTDLHQDPDTLDIWFSSVLWLFSTLGWPNKEAEDLKMFYHSNLVNYENKDLMVSKWPEPKEVFEYDSQEEVIEKIKEIIVEIRNIRSTKNIHPSKKAELILVTNKYEKELKEANGVLLKLGFSNKVTI